MKDDPKEKHEWNGKAVAHKDDSHHLTVAAAVREFDGKEPRDKAEENVYAEYLRERHLEGAAHHLSGLKAAHAAGNMREAARHHDMYLKHLHGAGLPKDGPIHSDVAAKMKEHGGKKVYKFKGHTSDSFVPSEAADEVKKNLDDRLGLVYEAACAIVALQKGDVVAFKPKAKDAGSATPALPAESAATSSISDIAPKVEGLDRKKFMDKANARAKADPPPMHGHEIETAHDQPQSYDYSHMLKPEHRLMGMKLFVQHRREYDGRKSKQGADTVLGDLYHNGKPLASVTAASKIASSPEAKWDFGHEHMGKPYADALVSAVRSHADWVGHHRAVEHTTGKRDFFHDEHE